MRGITLLQDNILDSFRPILEIEKREDMFDLRMLLLRVASIVAIIYGVNEFIKAPENYENFVSGSSEILSEVFEWGQNKFLGIPDNTT